MFYSNFEKKNYKALTFNIAHVPNFEIVSKLNKRRGRFVEEIRYLKQPFKI